MGKEKKGDYCSIAKSALIASFERLHDQLKQEFPHSSADPHNVNIFVLLSNDLSRGFHNAAAADTFQTSNFPLDLFVPLFCQS